MGTIMLGALMSCSSEFLKEYSQDLNRVKTVDDLNELLVGDAICLRDISTSAIATLMFATAIMLSCIL